MDKKVYVLALDALRRVKAEVKPYTRHGLCSLLARVTFKLVHEDINSFTREMVHIDVRNAMPLWPKYSGDPMFPVPAPSSHVGLSASTVFHEHDFMWEGEYGALRMELLDFLIAHFAEQVETLDTTLLVTKKGWFTQYALNHGKEERADNILGDTAPNIKRVRLFKFGPIFVVSFNSDDGSFWTESYPDYKTARTLFIATIKEHNLKRHKVSYLE